ncbi:MAG: SOS response-associated peptidase [Lysobacteraceae bacterium]
MRRFVQAIASPTDLPDQWPAEVRAAISASPDHYNLGKGDDAWVVRQVDGELQAVRMRWGLVPRWSRTPETPYTTVTARLERAPRSRIFGKPWQGQRCLVPMTGYYKWDRTVRPPVPHYLHAEDGRMLYAAGLWERWQGEDSGEPPFESFAVLTHPNAAIPAPLTPDGPVFIAGLAQRAWMDAPPLLAGAALRLTSTPALASYAVSRAHRDRGRSDYTLVEPREASDYLMPEPDAFDEEEDPDE